jgi:hypothetical protein
MRAVVTGTVVAVEDREFTKDDGSVSRSFDAFLSAANPRYAPDRISGPLELRPVVGSQVAYVCSFSAKGGRRGPWLSVWVVDELDPDTMPASLFAPAAQVA